MRPTDENTEHVYDAIAEGYYHFRQRPMIINAERYASTWLNGKLLDVGCGIATNSIVFAKHGFDCVGVDLSKQELFWAKRNMKKNGVSFPLIKSNCLALPFKDGTFDYAISIAVFHHLDSEEKRLKAFGEAYRVLKPGGTALITAWNKMQPRFLLGGADKFVPWTHNGVTHHRYYHMFTYGEMKKLAEREGFEAVKLFPEDSYKFPIKAFSRNVCALLKKGI